MPDTVLESTLASMTTLDAPRASVSLRRDAAHWTIPVALGQAPRSMHATAQAGIEELLASYGTDDLPWIAWLCEPVWLAGIALAALAEAALPDTSLVYADDDSIDEEGQRHGPNFRSAWDIELARTGDSTGPLIAFPAATVSNNAAARNAFIRGDPTAFVLAVASSAGSATVVHVPRVLAHRVQPARNATKAPGGRAYHTGLSTPREQCSVDGRAGAQRFTTADAAPDRAVAAAPAFVSLVIPSRDRPDLLEACLDSIFEKSAGTDYELIFVDNDSTDQRMPALYRRALETRRGRVVPVAGKFNFPRLCNAGAQAATGKVIVLLNNDTRVISPGWLEELVDVASERDVGAVGPLLLYDDGRIQHAGVLLGVNGTADNALANFARQAPIAREWCRSRRTVSAVVGACLAVRAEVYREVGGMDERFAVSHNEIDFCLRIAALGMRTVFTPHAVLAHTESATR